MMISPVGEWIMVKRIGNPAYSGAIIVPQSVEDKAPTVVVLEAGPFAYIYDDVTAEQEEKRGWTPGSKAAASAIINRSTEVFEKGEVLLVRSYGGVTFTIDGVEVLFVKPEHVIARFQKGSVKE